MKALLTRIAYLLWPEIKNLNPANRRYARIMLGTMFYTLPMSIAGLVWLALVTQPDVAIAHWLEFLILLVLTVIGKRLVFFVTIEVSPGAYTTPTASIDVVIWSAALVFGPTILWVELLAEIIQLVLRPAPRGTERWYSTGNFLLRLTALTIPRLAALWLYQFWGGMFPLPDMRFVSLLPALGATLVQLLLGMAIFFPMVLSYIRITARSFPDISRLRLLQSILILWSGTSVLLDPVSVFVTALYGLGGPGAYFFFVTVVLVGAAFGANLSRTAERTRQRSRELEQLEHLGRDLLAAPLDASTLPDLLKKHLPGMFSFGGVEVHLHNGGTLARHGESWGEVPAAAWNWLRTHPGIHSFARGEAPPWEGDPLQHSTLLLPILDTHNQTQLGGLYIIQHDVQGSIADIQPAAQTLAAQIASTLHLADVYQETLVLARTTRELTVAGEIQASFLPSAAPQIEGWQITAMLEAARETSGDFFDLISMWDNRLGVVMADVADKGLGAALYMALSRTLIRTYATEFSTRYPDNYAYHPERVFNTVNQCILQDTQSDLFVTAFYGILDPAMGTFTYANAGHNPPLLFSNQPGSPSLVRLTRTGLPIGILPDQTWDRGSVQLAPGDLLVLYTDGLTDAQNTAGEDWGDARLQATIERNLDKSVQDIRAAIIDEVHTFVGAAPSFDDISLMVLRNEKPV